MLPLPAATGPAQFLKFILVQLSSYQPEAEPRERDHMSIEDASKTDAFDAFLAAKSSVLSLV
ncbi:hypothetical protein EWM64_g7813 [Hericium alpestre]|uniref:Uncharacterized protein n=1 Tax=Hericium alpestre TaxID=135208 RepID=A0A4Y9ZQU1_9AGAM|nr:hypothetical protein EWM64_g7813 [Hericium alpestre]